MTHLVFRSRTSFFPFLMVFTAASFVKLLKYQVPSRAHQHASYLVPGAIMDAAMLLRVTT